ncbi:thiol-disulfide oxidoreductase DCC family protein [Flammeovirga agarivorans]|uniref:DUF393 domain-containing protein n=1 Tax=Flammeovirga agarivorans TaxID=2726742 RepID=A0A7X8XYH6_9BACT|nr:DCC1-like thiol-disulfide oxidoreductase family protein [Flammeovirga agarivorans]NLR94219.1 DUF393 domain-containing protein [Flammeovirga agarivorans]
MSKKVILFDGICNLCDKSVQFIIKHEKENTFQFASLQSPEGKELLKCYNLPIDYTGSIVLITHNNAYLKSEAALKIAKDLRTPWNIFRFGTIFPMWFTDSFYDLIAKNRYKIFGKKSDSCDLLQQNKKYKGSSASSNTI